MNHVADVLLEPLWWGGILLVLAYALRRKLPRAAPLLPAAAGATIALFSVPTVGNALVRALEQPVLTTIQPGVDYDAVIVLGGAMNLEVTADTGIAAFGNPVERVLAGFDLLRTGRAKNAILSGGSLVGTEAESRMLARQLESWGIDEGRLALDERSLNTHENAVESARIARERGWTHLVLVTSAAHMQRALGCFQREGLVVDTLAVDFESSDPAKHSPAFLPRAHALSQSTAAIREAVGRVVYRLRGWTR